MHVCRFRMMIERILALHERKRKKMKTIRQMVRHPAGRIGLTVGLAIGFVAATMGAASKALVFVGLCRFLASRISRS